MNMKRLFCMLLAILLVCQLCACGGENQSQEISSFAEQSSVNDSVESGALDSVPVFHSAADSFAGGSGTGEDPYQISSVEELVLFGKVNQAGYEGASEYNRANYILTADIAMNDVSGFADWGTTAPEYLWEPIDSRFCGVLDGNGYAISGMYINSAVQRCNAVGLFAEIRQAEIKNIKLTQSYIAADGCDGDVGTLAGSAEDCQLSGCQADGLLIVHNLKTSAAGGLVGSVASSTVSGCGFSGTIDAESCGGNIGGVAGSLSGYDGDGIMRDCFAEGSASLQGCGQAVAGGIAGYTGEGTVLSGCANRMDLAGEASSLGGIAGRVSVSYESAYDGEGFTYLDGRFEASSCTNYASITGGEGSAVGGVIGMVFNMDSRGESVLLSGLANQGAVSGGEGVGGIVGEISSGNLLYTVEDCENQGSVTGKFQAGGVAGRISSCVEGCRITGCANSGEIASGSPCGGVVGGYSGVSLLNGTEGLLTISQCMNTGIVENLDGISGTGGIMGQLYMDSEGESVLFEDCRNSGAIRSAGPAWLGGILGGPGTVMPGGSWTARRCINDGVLSIGSGTRDFAEDAALESAFLGSGQVDPASLGEEEYQASLEERAIHALGGSCVGGIVGKLWLGTIQDCSGEGTILLDAESSCYAGGICGQFYNSDGANGSSIRDCGYRAEWPFAAMPALGSIDDLPEGAMENVVAE